MRKKLLGLILCVVAAFLLVFADSGKPAAAETCCYNSITCAYSWAWCTTWATKCKCCTYYCNVWCDAAGYAWYEWYITCTWGSCGTDGS